MSKKWAVVFPHVLYFTFFLAVCVWLVVEPINMNYSLINELAIFIFLLVLTPIAPTLSALLVLLLEIKDRKNGVVSRNGALHTAAGVIGCISAALYALSVFGVACGLYGDFFSAVYLATVYFSVLGAVAIYALWLACLLRNKSHKRVLEYKYNKDQK